MDNVETDVLALDCEIASLDESPHFYNRDHLLSIALQKRAQIYKLEKNNKKALSDFSEALLLSPFDSNLLSEIADIYFNQNELEMSVSALKWSLVCKTIESLGGPEIYFKGINALELAIEQLNGNKKTNSQSYGSHSFNESDIKSSTKSENNKHTPDLSSPTLRMDDYEQLRCADDENIFGEHKTTHDMRFETGLNKVNYNLETFTQDSNSQYNTQQKSAKIKNMNITTEKLVVDEFNLDLPEKRLSTRITESLNEPNKKYDKFYEKKKHTLNFPEIDVGQETSTPITTEISGDSYIIGKKQQQKLSDSLIIDIFKRSICNKQRTGIKKGYLSKKNSNSSETSTKIAVDTLTNFSVTNKDDSWTIVNQCSIQSDNVTFANIGSNNQLQTQQITTIKADNTNKDLKLDSSSKKFTSNIDFIGTRKYLNAFLHHDGPSHEEWLITKQYTETNMSKLSQWTNLVKDEQSRNIDSILNSTAKMMDSLGLNSSELMSKISDSLDINIQGD